MAALTGGEAALAAVSMVPGRAVQPMLASPAVDVEAALAATGPASVEWKLDGARIQAHRSGGDVRLYTRNLNEITDRLGAVTALVADLPGGDLVLDGEVHGRRRRGLAAPVPGHDGRLRRRGADRVGGGGCRRTSSTCSTSAGPRSSTSRSSCAGSCWPRWCRPSARLPSIVTADPVEAAAFLDRSVGAGHEGVMVKSLESPYDAGRRGGAWRKIKPVHTLDLVVLAAEWGHGRRTGWLSNLHLGARGDDGTFVMVGKTFKGLTDELLRWQTETFPAYAVGTEDGYVMHLRPEIVVEIALDGVQVSTRYPGGVALRFARVKRYRPDKSAADADPIDDRPVDAPVTVFANC